MNILDLSDTQNRTLPRMLQLQARDNGDAIFLISDDARISFAETEQITDKIAGGLQELGVGKGDRVVMYLGNRPEVVLIALAANKLGALWTPINTDYKGEWLADAFERSRGSVLISSQVYQKRLKESIGANHSLPLVLLDDGGSFDLPGAIPYDELSDHAPITCDYESLHYGDSCAILWTSGTTGRSKGVLQSHNCWIRAIQGASRQFQSRPGDIIYGPLPLYNTAAWITAVLRALAEGIPCVIESKFSVSRFIDRIREFGATQTFVLGAMGVFLWNTPERADDADISLRVAGISPMPPDIWDGFEKRFGLRILRGGFGMSELQAAIVQIDTHPGVPPYSLGFPFEDIDIQLCDDEGRIVDPGQSGELCVRAREPFILFNGYFDSPEATAATFRDEWFLTGDILRQDVDTGAYYFVDRKKDAVRFAGRNISTLEVESVARKHPKVADVAAFGISSAEVAGESELKLDIVLKEGTSLSAEELCEFINANAPHFFVPRYVEFVASLPYTPTNKVQKYILRSRGVGDSAWDQKQSKFTVMRD